jgi:hypothetical protein
MSTKPNPNERYDTGKPKKDKKLAATLEELRTKGTTSIDLDYVPGPQLSNLPAMERIDPEPQPARKPKADTEPPLNEDEEKKDKP